MEIEIKPRVYMYGKVWDMLNKKEDENFIDWISIYTHPQTFGKVPLSSMEGYFVSFHDQSLLGTDKLSELLPQFSIKRNSMSKTEKEFNGKFFPFEK